MEKSKEYYIRLAREDDKVFGTFSEDLSNDFDIALSACKYTWEAHKNVGEKLWNDPYFVLELVKYEREQFLKNGENESLQVGGIIVRCPDDIRQGLYEDIKSTNPDHYGMDINAGAGWTTKEGYIYEYDKAIQSLNAIIELRKDNISYSNFSPLKSQEKNDFSKKLQSVFKHKSEIAPTKRIKI